jgi:hypothetical protein
VADPEHAARFRAPISTALPACAVVDHLCAWLRLPAGAWNLCQGERIFSPHLLMDEVDFNQPLVLKR